MGTPSAQPGRSREPLHSDQAEPDGVSPPLPLIAQAALAEDVERTLPAHAEHDRNTVLASGALGIVMFVAAVAVVTDAASLRPSDAAVGPAAMPTIVGILLGLVGVGLVVRSVLDLRTATVNQRPLTRARLLRLAGMVGVLVAFAVLLPILGYVVTATMLFTGAALLLGAPHPARVVAYGWTLAVVVFLVFDGLIGLALPTGPWGF